MAKEHAASIGLCGIEMVIDSIINAAGNRLQSDCVELKFEQPEPGRDAVPGFNRTVWN